MNSKVQNFQIFVQSKDLQIPTQAVNIENPGPGFTLKDLKITLLPKIRETQTLNEILYFTFNGKPLPDSLSLKNSLITPLSTLNLRLRLLGGGGDGGATGAESRDCYLNMYATKKPDKIDPNEIRLSRWLNCALSNEPLKHPVVIDRLGNLFNKKALVEALLEKRVPKQFGHVKGLKDMISVELSENPGFEERSDGSRFQCPVTGLEFNGKYKFFAVRTCGHVLSAKALKEVKSSSCLVCHKDFLECDKIVINGNEEEVVALRERMEEDRAKLKDNKKGKKAPKMDVDVNREEGIEVRRVSGKKHAFEDNKSMEKVLGKVDANGKVSISGKIETKGVKNESAKRFKATDIAPANATKEVYASIFTSSKKSEFKETFTCRSLPLGRN